MSVIAAVAVVLVLDRFLLASVRMLARSAAAAVGSNLRKKAARSTDNISVLASSLNILLARLTELEMRTVNYEERYRRVTNNIPVGLIIIDREKKVVEVNPRMVEWFRRVEDFRGKTFPDILADAYPDQELPVL